MNKIMVSRVLMALMVSASMLSLTGTSTAYYNETYNMSDVLPIVVDTGLMGVIEVQPHIPEFVSILVLVWMFTLFGMAATAAVGVVYVLKRKR